ncbi:MAG: hypothetical protein ACYTG3_09720 [Planctomycetota bacterium]|jgi:hypothetical protein
MSADTPDHPRHHRFVLRMKTTRLIEPFPPGGKLRTISRAGLNGFRAIERGQSAGEGDERQD